MIETAPPRKANIDPQLAKYMRPQMSEVERRRLAEGWRTFLLTCEVVRRIDAGEPLIRVVS